MKYFVICVLGLEIVFVVEFFLFFIGVQEVEVGKVGVFFVGLKVMGYKVSFWLCIVVCVLVQFVVGFLFEGCGWNDFVYMFIRDVIDWFLIFFDDSLFYIQ